MMRHQANICWYATLFPSPRLQRLGPDCAAFRSSISIVQSEDFLRRRLPSSFLSCGFPKIAPPPTSTLCVLSRLLIQRMTRLRCHVAKRVTPSAPVVPPNCDGLLRILPCRFVAPYFQPWGSGRFQHNLPLAALLQPSVPRAFPRPAYRTLRSFSLRDSRTVSPQPLPSRRCLELQFLLFLFRLLYLINNSFNSLGL